MSLSQKSHMDECKILIWEKGMITPRWLLLIAR